MAMVRSGLHRTEVGPRSWMQEFGRALVILAAVIGLIGILLWGGWFPRWLGRLPGDIGIEKAHSAFYFPIVTCILISLFLSLLFSLFRR
jgi:Protein of unknown function (DUF2905)